jgi:hypothetical protein
MTLLKIVEKYFICILLVLVALIQLYHSQFDRLTPWKGGGFGMFSTNKKANISAIGYTSNGDSLIINVIGSKLDIPISKNFLNATLNYPKKEKLEKLAYLIRHAYLKPSTLTVPLNIDSLSADLILKTPNFYKVVYQPTYYQNEKNAQLDGAVQVEKVKILLYETDFYEKEMLFRKRYVDEYITKK